MILVTGSGGFIGSHLVEYLVREGREVRAFLVYNSAGRRGWLEALPPKILERVRIVFGDVRDESSVRSAVRDCEGVLHLAALISIPYSYATPEAFIETNVRGTLNVLQAAREARLERVVCVSTSEVYGSAQQAPITEEHPLRAQSPYAASKCAADQLALSFFHSFETPVTILRPFNTYGPRQSMRAVIPAIIGQLAAGNPRVRLGALHPRRDFTFVEDTVRGMAAALEAPGAVGEIIQLGSGFEISIGATAELIGEAMGVKAEASLQRERLRPERSEVTRLWADSSKAKRLLGWEARYSGRDGLLAGLRRTAAWFSNAENLARYRADEYRV